MSWYNFSLYSLTPALSEATITSPGWNTHEAALPRSVATYWLLYLPPNSCKWMNFFCTCPPSALVLCTVNGSPHLTTLKMLVIKIKASAYLWMARLWCCSSQRNDAKIGRSYEGIKKERWTQMDVHIHPFASTFIQ